jgi:hypothetical protein
MEKHLSPFHLQTIPPDRLLIPPEEKEIEITIADTLENE